MSTVAEPSLIPGTFNARRLGGLPAGPRRTLESALVRSDAPGDLGEAGRDVVRSLGIHAAVDLRHPIELAQHPADFDGLDITVISQPIIEDLSAASGLSLEAIYDTILSRRGAALAAAAQAIADADPDAGPVLIFCSAGKDRTGILSALLLATVGVDDDAIVADYHRTELNMQGEFRARIERRARESGIEDQELAVKLGAPEALIRHVLDEVRSRYGSAAAFLRQHGLTAEGEAALRRRFLGDDA